MPHGTHVHGTHSHGGHTTTHAAESSGELPVDERHDHDGDRDVAAVDLGAGSAKLPVFLVRDTLEFLASPSRGETLSGDLTLPPLARGLHWRPPLRGPPRLSV